VGVGVGGERRATGGGNCNCSLIKQQEEKTWANTMERFDRAAAPSIQVVVVGMIASSVQKGIRLVGTRVSFWLLSTPWM
jgi:hypothetical protein